MSIMQKFKKINFTLDEMNRLGRLLNDGMKQAKEQIDGGKLELQQRQQLVDRILDDIARCNFGGGKDEND